MRPLPSGLARRRELDVHPVVMDSLARVGEALMDPSTRGGERRLRAKYADRTGDY